MIIQLGPWIVKDLKLSKEKILQLWSMMQRHKPLFSDLTQGDFGNFVRCITGPHTMWFEVRKQNILVGIIWFGGLEQEVDVQGHMMFFDRKPAEKLQIVRATVQWMFENFPLQRLTVEIPSIYTSLNRLLVKIGLTFEGKKREAVLLGNKWRDILIFGVTRKEVTKWAF